MKTQSSLVQSSFTSSLSLTMSIPEFGAKPLLMIECHSILPEESEELSSIEIEETKKVSDLIKIFEDKCTSSSSLTPNKLNKKRTDTPHKNEKMSSLIQKFGATSEDTVSNNMVLSMDDSSSVKKFIKVQILPSMAFLLLQTLVIAMIHLLATIH